MTIGHTCKMSLWIKHKPVSVFEQCHVVEQFPKKSAATLPSCPFTKPSEMDLKLLPLPQNQPASVCCDLVDQIDGRHQQERVRDCLQCCTLYMWVHNMYRNSKVKLERKRVVGMVQWSQRCWD